MTARRSGWRTITGVIGLVVLLLFDGQPAWAQGGRSTGLPLPRFVSLGAERVNVRFGPGTQYPVNWVYARKGLPVEIIEEFDTWRKVRDYDGDEGWIHASLLSSRRTIMVTDEPDCVPEPDGQVCARDLRRTPSIDSRVVLRAEPGVIGDLFDCEEDWCRVEIEGRRGWLQRSEFWGTRPGEIVR